MWIAYLGTREGRERERERESLLSAGDHTVYLNRGDGQSAPPQTIRAEPPLAITAAGKQRESARHDEGEHIADAARERELSSEITQV